MAELTPQERLQPCLLDRLADADPKSQQESRDQRVVSLARLREAIVRDLSWLLNTSSYPEPETFEAYPEVISSVLNYGVRDVRGTGAGGGTIAELRRLIADAVRQFEPRILPGSLRIEPIETRRDAHLPTQLAFEIECEIWAQPVPDRLFLRTEVDLETGLCSIERG